MSLLEKVWQLKNFNKKLGFKKRLSCHVMLLSCHVMLNFYFVFSFSL
jgi:hypothetical protein